MKHPLRFASSLLMVGFLLSCHSDKSTPTQPVAMTPTPMRAATPTPGVMNPTPTPAAMAHVVNVGQGGNVFVDPQSGNSTTTIRAGQTVMWVWMSGPHSTTSGVCCNPDGKWDSGTMSSGNFSQTFPTAGTFPYYCRVHLAAMTGTIMVNP